VELQIVLPNKSQPMSGDACEAEGVHLHWIRAMPSYADFPMTSWKNFLFTEAADRNILFFNSIVLTRAPAVPRSARAASPNDALPGGRKQIAGERFRDPPASGHPRTGSVDIG
jgi:hypothetical protein